MYVCVYGLNDCPVKIIFFFLFFVAIAFKADADAGAVVRTASGPFLESETCGN